MVKFRLYKKALLDPSYTSKDGLPDRARFPNMENVR